MARRKSESKTPSVFSDDGPIFGREAEAAAFEQALRDAEHQGLTVLVVGAQGMGKSTLVRRFQRVADDLGDCSWKAYEMRERDDPDVFMERLYRDIFGMTRIGETSLWNPGPNTAERLVAFFGFLRSGADKLVESILPKQLEPTWVQVFKLFEEVSQHLDERRRFVFFIDANKYLHDDTGAAWAGMLSRLPPKFVIVFAVRPEDKLAHHHDVLGSCRLIPQAQLRALEAEPAAAYIATGLKDAGDESPEAAEALSHYEGWPIAIDTGLRFLKQGGKASQLPEDSKRLPDLLFTELARQGSASAIDLIKALVVLQIPPPTGVLAEFLSLSTSEVETLVTSRTVASVTNPEPEGLEIFHSLFSDYVEGRIRGDGEWQGLHERAAKVYEKRLATDERDLLALRRLPWHVKEARGDEGFALTVNVLFSRKRTLGLLSEAIAEWEAVLAGDLDPEGQAGAMGNLGILYRTRGDLERAEEMYRKSLAINEKLGRKEGMANNYGNLGNVYRTRGDLEKAEEMALKALTMNEELGREEGMAGAYGNLGILYQTRGDYTRAEEMTLKALAISENLGLIELNASHYGNLGILYKNRGDLDGAEEMFLKSLAINEQLGRKEGIAIQFGNLGTLSKTRGDLDQTREYWERSARLYGELGNQGQADEIRGWIAELDADKPS